MLKIQRGGNGETVLTVSGRLEADCVSEFSALLGSEILVDAHVKEGGGEVGIGIRGLGKFHCGESDSAGLHEIQGNGARDDEFVGSVSGFNGIAARIVERDSVGFIGVGHGCGPFLHHFLRRGLSRLGDRRGHAGCDRRSRSLRNGNLAS